MRLWPHPLEGHISRDAAPRLRYSRASRPGSRMKSRANHRCRSRRNRSPYCRWPCPKVIGHRRSASPSPEFPAAIILPIEIGHHGRCRQRMSGPHLVEVRTEHAHPLAKDSPTPDSWLTSVNRAVAVLRYRTSGQVRNPAGSGTPRNPPMMRCGCLS